MPQVNWLAIELGHLSTSPDTNYQHCDPGKLTTDQQTLLMAIRCTARAAWSAGGTYDLTSTQLQNDDWVAEKLQEALNGLLMPGIPPVKIQSDDVVVAATRRQGLSSGYFSSGDPGTHCRLRGDRWINERSYYLLLADGTPWLGDQNLPNHLSPNHIATATLVWQCRVLAACDPAGSALPK